MKLSQELVEAAQTVNPNHWKRFQEDLERETTQRFVGSRDPTKALEFFAEMQAIKKIVLFFVEESEKKYNPKPKN